MRITSITLIGVALIVLGIVAFAYRGIPYQAREKVMDMSPVQPSVDNRKIIPMPPLMIGLLIASGAALVAVGSKKSS